MGEKDNRNSAGLGRDLNTKLSDILDFGPDKIKPTPQAKDTNERIKKLLKQLQEINARVDKLTDRF